jgi:hypothetical protein
VVTNRSANDRLRSQQRARKATRQLSGTRRRSQAALVVAAVGTVLAVIVALVVVKLATGPGGSSGSAATTASSRVAHAVQSVPAPVLNKVGVGSAQPAPTNVSAPALTANGKPLVFYAGAEYCPYCAAERWAVAVALSRFGTFSNLGETHSSAQDVYPSTATLSFHGATYKSSYLTLTAKEMESNKVVNGGYAPLDRLSTSQQNIIVKYDAPPYFSTKGSIPFIDIGGKWLLSGASYSPQVLQGKTQQQIAAALTDPTSPIARGVDGSANLITAALCQITNGKPGAVCSSPAVTTARTRLAHAG